MLHAREDWSKGRECADVLAFPAQTGAKGDFGRRSEKAPFSLVVDLHAEEIGFKWFRGATTLAALCSAAIFLTPDWHPKVPTPANPQTRIKYAPLSELGMAQPSIIDDAATGLPKPIGVQSGTSGNVKRVRGEIAGGLYFSLRAAGATPQIATDYLMAIQTHIDVGEVAPYDRFDFAVVKGPTGEPDKLIFAGLDRFQYSDVQLLKWSTGGRTDWFDGSTSPQANGLMAPVAGRITSGFGYRVHPILRYARLHAGIDIGAPWGSPIVAAADGQVVGAGYSGGYGRQVRIMHSGGVMTVYGHMSSIIAQPGLPVRQGQVIGYVGSSGLATGPHLHFEVRIGGRPVNPLTARLVSRPAFQGPQLAAFKSRLKEILAIPVKPQQPAGAAAAS